MNKERIIEAAYVVAQEYGFSGITRSRVAKAAFISPGLVNHYLGTMDELRDEVMKMAISKGDLPIIRYGLAVNDPIAEAAPVKLKKQAFSL